MASGEQCSYQCDGQGALRGVLHVSAISWHKKTSVLTDC